MKEITTKSYHQNLTYFPYITFIIITLCPVYYMYIYNIKKKCVQDFIF